MLSSFSKKDGTKSLCYDYRELNLKIVRDNFPVAVINDVVQNLQDAKLYWEWREKNHEASKDGQSANFWGRRLTAWDT